MSYQVPSGYVPISSSALWPLGAAYIPILLSEVEQEQRACGNEDREAIAVGAGLCDSEGERANTGYAPLIIRNVSANVFSLRRSDIFFCHNVRCHVLAEMSFAETSFAKTDGIPWSSGKMLAFQPRGFVFEPLSVPCFLHVFRSRRFSLSRQNVK